MKITKLIIGLCIFSLVILSGISYANNNGENLINQARTLYQGKSYAQSLILLKEVLNKYPESEVAIKAKAAIIDCYQKLKDYDLVIEKGQKFIDKYPKHEYVENIELLIGRSLFHKGEYEAAANKYISFIQEYQNSVNLAEAYYFLGECYEKPARYTRDKRKLLKQALKSYQKVIIDFPDSRWANSANANIGMTYYSLEEYDDAISYFNTYINNNPSGKMLGSCLNFLGICYERLGRTEEAEKTYKRIIEELPNTNWAKYAKRHLKKL